MKIHNYYFKYIGNGLFDVYDDNNKCINCITTTAIIHYINNPEYVFGENLPNDSVLVINEFTNTELMQMLMERLMIYSSGI